MVIEGAIWVAMLKLVCLYGVSASDNDPKVEFAQNSSVCLMELS